MHDKGEQECQTESEPHHLANSSLDDGIKASLWGIPVSGHHLLFHLLCEATHLFRQGEDMFVAELRQTGGVDAVEHRSRY